MSQRVPIEQLVDVERLHAEGARPTPKQLREALPPGWLLDEDGRHARRDLRVLARDGWVLVVGLVCFGAAGLAFFYETFPKGGRGLLRFVALVVVVLLAGGFVAPMITRALLRRGGRRE